MGLDSGLVKAFGLFGAVAIAMGAGGAFTVARVTENSLATLFFLPMVATYSAIITLAWVGLAIYVRLRERPRRID